MLQRRSKPVNGSCAAFAFSGDVAVAGELSFAGSLDSFDGDVSVVGVVVFVGAGVGVVDVVVVVGGGGVCE
jgi:hypothetical protein